jgi:Ca2+-dependent lipid-binding protein
LNQVSTAKSLGVGVIDLRNIQPMLPNEFLLPLQNKQNQGDVQLRLKFVPEFLSSNKRKSGFGATFLGAGVGAVAGGVGAVGQGAMDVTGAVGKGAFKGVGAVGKGVFGGLSAGASAMGLHKNSDKSGSQGAIDPSSQAAPAQMSQAMGVPGNLTIHVIEADGLLGVDKSGTSDPYVKVAVNGQSVLKTKVKKDTLAPNWNESALVKGLSGQPVVLNFLVKDHNTIGGNKDLGDCDLPLWEYIVPATDARPGQYRADFWAPLGGSGGRLHLMLEFEPTQ